MSKKILILNCGSSSIKYALFVGEREMIRENVAIKKNYTLTLKKIISSLVKKNHLEHKQDLTAIGHRVVHGGNATKSTLITSTIIKEIKKYAPFAPLHNPHNLKGILICKKLFPQTKQIAVFDTAFHTSVTKEKRIYAIPCLLTKKYGIKSYGFHGQSYQYICSKLKELKKQRRIRAMNKVIVCHLGSGCSICAIKHGKSVAVTSGMTTFSGMPMATRCGDIDIGIVPYLQQQLKKPLKEVMRLLDHESGFYGISGIKDMKIIIEKRKHDKQAQLAIDVFCHHLKRWIAGYFGLLNGADGIVFTAGIGEHGALIREKALQNMAYAGIMLDKKKNNKNKMIISAKKSKVQVLVIPTDEEKAMADEVKMVLHLN